MSARALFVTLFISISSAALAADDKNSSSEVLARGKYLLEIGGCNDCHTAGYIEANGAIPESDWLLGSNVGFRGPWGTSYAKNLRLSMPELTQEEWLTLARSPMLPPMPTPSMKAMTDKDLIAIYSFVKSLGVAGSPTPIALGPEEKVMTPYIYFVPVQDK